MAQFFQSTNSNLQNITIFFPTKVKESEVIAAISKITDGKLQTYIIPANYLNP